MSQPAQVSPSCHRKSLAHNNYQVARPEGETEFSHPRPGSDPVSYITTSIISPRPRDRGNQEQSGAKEMAEKGTMLVASSSSDAADHPQCESCHCLAKAFYSHTITITSPWSLLPFPHPGPRLIEGQVRGARWGAQPAPGDIL